MTRPFLIALLGAVCAAPSVAGLAPGPSRAAAASVRVEVSDALTGAALARSVVSTSDGTSFITGADGAVSIGPLSSGQPYRTIDVTVRSGGYDAALWRGVRLYAGNTTIVPFRMTRTGRTQVTDEPRLGIETPGRVRDSDFHQPEAPFGGGGIASLGPEPLVIRVWRKAKSTAAGYNIVENILFEDYVKGVVPAEWYSSWNAESLKAGCVAARTYGWYHVIYPKYASIGADVSDDAYSQVYSDSRVASTNSAADATRSQALTYGGNVISAEYSAENADPTTAGGVPYEPSVSDPVCAGKTLYGHGRGMCQWGSQRWAIGATGSNGPKTYDWILSHYYSSNTLLETAGGGLEVGDCAAVEGGSAAVKTAPSGTLIANLPSGTLVHILAGPAAYGGQNYWQVEWPMPTPTRNDGWMTAQMLVETACPPRGVGISGISVGDVTDTTATVRWASDVAASTVVHYGRLPGSLTLTATGPAGTDHVVSLSGLTSSAAYYFTVESAAAGYVTNVSGVQTFQTAATVVPLQITGYAIQTIGETSASVFWQTDQPADTTAAYGLSADGLTQTATGLTNTLFHSAQLTGLTPDTTYYVRGTSSAPGYATASTDVLSFRTFQALQFSDITAGDIQADHAKVSWTLNTPANVSISYGAKSGSPDLSDSVGPDTSFVDLYGLQPDTVYYYRLVASMAGHADVTSPEMSFRTATLGSVSITGVAVSNVTRSGATVAWTTSPAASGTVHYGAAAGPPYESSASDATGTAHSVTLTGLPPGRDVHFSVESAALGYTPAATPDASFTTLALPGDLNNDGAVTAADAILALRVAAGADVLAPGALGRADLAVPADGRVDVSDGIVVLRIVSGLLSLP